MRTIWIVIAVLAATVLNVGGCGQDYRVRSIFDTSEPWAVIRRNPNNFNLADALRDDEYRVFLNPYTYAPSLASEDGRLPVNSRHLSLYSIASGMGVDALSKSPEITERNRVRKEARNQLQNAVMRVSDEMTVVHLSGIRAADSSSNFISGAVTTGLAAGASVAAPVVAAPLAAGAAGTNALRSLSNEQFFRNIVTEQVFTAIQSQRGLVRNAIIKKQSMPIEEYDIERALADATTYHEMGSFLYGLALVRHDIEVANAARVSTSLKGFNVDQPRLAIDTELTAPSVQPKRDQGK